MEELIEILIEAYKYTFTHCTKAYIALLVVLVLSIIMEVINRMTICTSDCVDCIHGTIDDSNKARIKIHCDEKDKDYWFGQMLDCDDYEKEKN